MVATKTLRPSRRLCLPDQGLFFQGQMVQHAGPTLAGMKLGSLFRIVYDQVPNVAECVAYFQSKCSPFGYDILILKATDKDCLIYLYHHTRLQSCLASPAIQSLLSVHGYTDFSVEGAIARLEARLQSPNFPHEIGVFLGYPLQDVRAYLDGSLPCLDCGYWKVFFKPNKCQKQFKRYDCCLKHLANELAKGCPLSTLLARLN